jgi:hypothetical protein
LLDKPEVSLAVALGDHNFTDLKEFAIGQGGAAAGSDVTVAGSLPTSTTQSSQGQSASRLSMQVETCTVETVLPCSQSALSLSHILNPTNLNNLDVSQTPENPSLTSEDVYTSLHDTDAMEIDVPSSCTSLISVEKPLDNPDNCMCVDEQNSDVECLGQQTKSGLLSWLKVGAGKKRTSADAEISSLNSDESISGSKTGLKGGGVAKRIKSAAGISGVGLSRAATAARELRKKVQNGEFKPNLIKLEKWVTEIKSIDKNAEVNRKTAKDIRHSKCGRWYKAKEPYDTYRFRKHVNDECASLPKSAAAGIPTISQWRQKFDIDVHNPNSPKAPRCQPCPGITERDDHRVPIYLERTGATGGGARSITIIAKERFGKIFSLLSKRRKQEVLDVQNHEHKWHNDHKNNRVFSHDCLKDVERTDDNNRVLPCPNCACLLRNHNFRQALNKPRPKDENFAYINKRWRPSGKLIQLFGRVTGLREIIEESVCRRFLLRFIRLV